MALNQQQKSPIPVWYIVIYETSFGMLIKKKKKKENYDCKKNNNYNHLYQKYVLHLPVERGGQGWPNVVNIIKTFNRILYRGKG